MRWGLACAVALLILVPAATGATPVVTIQVTPATGAAPLSVAFAATGEAATYHWDFGDGSSADGRTATHTYAAGRWTATLTAQSSDGEVTTQTTTITAYGLTLAGPNPAPYDSRVFFRGTAAPAEGNLSVALVGPRGKIGVARTRADGSYVIAARIRLPGAYRATSERAGSNVSNTVGLVPGSAAGAFGYRHELSGQRSRTARMAVASVLGGLAGAVLLLTLPASAFKAIVPVFIAIALVLILLQPRLSRALEGRRERGREHAGPLALAGMFAAGIYGGYFGAAQGIMVLAILTLSLDDELQRLNALKVVLTGLVNLVSGIVFILVANIAWLPTVLIAGGSILGAVFGARAGRRLSPRVLRGVIVVVGILAIVRLLT